MTDSLDTHSIKYNIKGITLSILTCAYVRLISVITNWLMNNVLNYPLN